MLWQIVLQIFLIALNAVFACAETAVISSNPTKLEKPANDGDKRAVKLQKLINESPKVLAGIRTAVTFSGFIGSAFCADFFAPKLVSLAHNIGLNGCDNIIHPVSVVAVTLILSCVMLLFGELVPKRMAMKNPEKLALSMTAVINAVRIIFAPLVWVLNFLTDIILKIMGVNPENKNATVTEEEIIMMSDVGAEKGTIDETENRIIKNIFAFDDMTAEQICTHRTDVSVLWSSDSVETWEETIHRTRHSRFPVCDENIDHIVGILNAKDYFRLDDKSRENIMKNAVREPYFVHENMKADSLFAQMKKSGGHHFAVVVDEYGGMSGIITVTDLVEQLVGDFDDDELNQPEVKFRRTGENEWIIPGITSLSDVCEELEISLPSDKYDTFGGYVIDFLGEIPKNSTTTSFNCDGLHIEVLEIHHHRIKVCRVTKITE
ncbi:MAG: hemolysin family protein [Ruminococcus flavefaciens]|nr:hemolysin family protein [Ruminococcus flavefaciens]MCM1228972.1 hemolysin family protein [Ruminococcus flavefaciens]